MPKVTVYLSDELYREAKARNLSLSSLTQEAVERALAKADLADWIERARKRKTRFEGRLDTQNLIDEVREGFGR
jgi:post-segregation antitoxin (ccd killing protein)